MTIELDSCTSCYGMLKFVYNIGSLSMPDLFEATALPTVLQPDAALAGFEVRTLTFRDNITVQLTSCLFCCLDSAALAMLNAQ